MFVLMLWEHEVQFVRIGIQSNVQSSFHMILTHLPEVENEHDLVIQVTLYYTSKNE